MKQVTCNTTFEYVGGLVGWLTMSLRECISNAAMGPDGMDVRGKRCENDFFASP